MNNHRLLSGVIVMTLWSGGVCAMDRQHQILTIEELFEVAEANSVQLRPFITSEEEARREINVARDNRLPEINAGLSLSYIGDGFTTKRNLSGYEKAPIPHFGSGLSISISQPVYSGGAITTGIELAELKSTASRFSTALQRDNIRFAIAGDYLDIYKCHNLKRVVENNLLQARKVLEEMQVSYQHGTVLKNDITRYELLVANLELQLTKIENTLAILNNNLVTTSGLPENTVVYPDTTILQRALPTAGEDWWQQEASANAPALKLAGAEVEINCKAENLVKSERLPKVGLQAGWSIDGPILVEVPPINRNLSYWYVGVGVSYNIASLYKNDRALAKSKAATQVARDRLEATRENISVGIRADYIRYLEGYEELKTMQKSVELADRNYHTISNRYGEGMALITDLLDAVNSKLEAEQQLVNAQINIIYYYYKLLFTSGKI